MGPGRSRGEGEWYQSESVMIVVSGLNESAPRYHSREICGALTVIHIVQILMRVIVVVDDQRTSETVAVLHTFMAMIPEGP